MIKVKGKGGGSSPILLPPEDFRTVAGAVSEVVLLRKTECAAWADDADSAMRLLGYYAPLGLLPVIQNDGDITWIPSPDLGTT